MKTYRSPQANLVQAVIFQMLVLTILIMNFRYLKGSYLAYLEVNSPISAYAMYAPIRYFDEDEGLWIGGQFWDSRATGDNLGDRPADQALGPFLNSVEMANPDKAAVIADI